MFGKYHVVIFKDHYEAGRSLRLRGGVGVLLCCLFLVLLAANIWLAHAWLQTDSSRAQLKEAEKTIQEQSAQLLGMMSRISEVREDLERVQQFNAKLRLIMNMENDPENVSVGGAHTESFAEYLPLRRQELMARKMNTFLKQLTGTIRLEEVRQQELLLALRANRDILAAIPSVWPIDGFITSRFGARPDPFTGRRENHKGLDIGAKMGTPIRAPGRGTVIFSGEENGYGNTILIQHGGGITTRYAHMSRRAAQEGQTLQRGDIIGYVGSTGRSSGPHLHYEVKLNGVNVNPLRYILN